MSLQARSLVVVLGCLLACFAAAPPREAPRPYTGAACTGAADDYFSREVWAKVGSVRCLTCHKKGGDAEESKLVLRDPRKLAVHDRDEALRHNRDAFTRLARVKHKD